jgi:predicted patatin/cPLA2 family phospholipase
MFITSNSSKLFLFALLLAVLSGCAKTPLINSVPRELIEHSEVTGMTSIRTWGDHVDEWYIDSLVDSVHQEIAYYSEHPSENRPKTADILALSGGGSDGAFGAGILCGWSAKGDRPKFKLVTGISTGALIAPIAFLGSEYDDVLKRAYTTITDDDVLKPRGILSILNSDGLAETDPLFMLLNEWITPEMFNKVAAEHSKGRRLLIATVNLEAQRPVIWDMGAIASSRHPDAINLFRTIMLASASIPGAFEPQYIRVEVNGKTYEELHVDGGTAAQVFLWGAGVNVKELSDRAGVDAPSRKIRLFVIRNGRFHAEYHQLRNRFINIANRAVSTLIKTQGIGDMFRLYTIAMNNGMEFNLASIPPSFTLEATTVFDKEYMDALFNFGFDQAIQGYKWQHKPPYMDEN